MLDRLRFQEVEKAIFKIKYDGIYGDKKYCKGEPFLILDNVSMSNFNIEQTAKVFSGRSSEGSTSNINAISFELSNGNVMLNLLGSIYGKISHNNKISYTMIEEIEMIDSNKFSLKENPLGDLLIYINDNYGDLVKLSSDQVVSINEKEVTLIKNTSKKLTCVYNTVLYDEKNYNIEINQLGAELIMELELHCSALDILTEEKKGVLLKFPKVVIGTDLSINFNNSKQISESTIYVLAVPEDIQNKVNKNIFSMDIL